MECHNHPDREAVANCSVCGKAVCPECSMEIAGNIYCKDCVNEIVTKSIMEKSNQEPSAPKTLAKEVEGEAVEEPVAVIEPIDPITPIQEEEEVIAKPIEKAPENFETDFEYETEYVETYEEDGAEDSYYENPEPIPEPEPEYKEHQRKLEQEAIEKQKPIEPIHTEDIDEDFYIEEEGWDTVDYIDTGDDKYHHASGTITVIKRCWDCEKELSRETYQVDENRQHDYDEDGVCVVCNHKNTCTHEHTAVSC